METENEKVLIQPETQRISIKIKGYPSLIIYMIVGCTREAINLKRTSDPFHCIKLNLSIHNWHENEQVGVILPCWVPHADIYIYITYRYTNAPPHACLMFIFFRQQPLASNVSFRVSNPGKITSRFFFSLVFFVEAGE